MRGLAGIDFRFDGFTASPMARSCHRTFLLESIRPPPEGQPNAGPRRSLPGWARGATFAGQARERGAGQRQLQRGGVRRDADKLAAWIGLENRL